MKICSKIYCLSYLFALRKVADASLPFIAALTLPMDPVTIYLFGFVVVCKSCPILSNVVGLPSTRLPSCVRLLLTLE